jgi:hypothetical protein
MKGSIRIVAGFLLMLGGVGGIETNETVTLPLDSLAIAVAGMAIMAWGALSANKCDIS